MKGKNEAPSSNAYTTLFLIYFFLFYFLFFSTKQKTKQIMKKLFILLLASTIILMSSCTDSEIEKFSNYGNEFKIEMYSGGQLVRTWISTGKVVSEQNSDGYYFKDKSTNKLVEVSGDIVITNND